MCSAVGASALTRSVRRRALGDSPAFFYAMPTSRWYKAKVPWLKSLFLLCAVLPAACGRHRVDKPAVPDAAASVSAAQATPAPSASAPTSDGTLHAEVDSNGMQLGASQVALDPLEIRGALARSRGTASILTLTIRDGTAPEALWSVLLGARGTELQRVVVERKANVTAVALHEEQRPRRRLLLLGNDQLQLVAGTRDRSPPTSWKLGEPVGEQAAWAELKRACAEDPCSVRLELVRGDAPRLPSVLDSWQRISSGLPKAMLTLGTTSVSARETAIKAVMRENLPSLIRCYEGGLAKNPKLQADMKLRIVLGPDGRPSQVTNVPPLFPDQAVRDCILQSVSRLQFPAPEGGRLAVVYPLVLAHGEPE